MIIPMLLSITIRVSPNIYMAMEDRSQAKNTIIICGVSIFLLYEFVLITGYLFFGQYAETPSKDLFDNLNIVSLFRLYVH
jgi:hypothetical protein